MLSHIIQAASVRNSVRMTFRIALQSLKCIGKLCDSLDRVVPPPSWPDKVEGRVRPP
jgi:hypothetical protein